MANLPHRYAIALGSNRRHGRHGAPSGVIRAALGALDDADLKILDVSPILSTEALGPAGRGFANAATIVATSLDPPALLARLKAMERAFGRRRGRRWGPRVLDLDIVLWSGGGWRAARAGALRIPHRALAGRRFVLDPLVAIAPDWRLPSGVTVRQLHARLTHRRPLHR